MRRSQKGILNTLLSNAVYHDTGGEIEIAGEDWILMSAQTFRNVVKGLGEVIETSAKTMLHEAGRHAGKEFTKALIRQGTPRQEVPDCFRTFFTYGGWGKIDFQINYETMEATVTVQNCATARRISSDEPSCDFITGFVAGVADCLLDTLSECNETKCMAKGDPFCEFRVAQACVRQGRDALIQNHGQRPEA